MWRVLGLCGASCALVLAASPFVTAQQSITTASITGQVTDESGAAVPGATVVIRSVERNQQLQATTSRHGGFRFLSLQVGAYRLTVSAGGFATQTVRVRLGIGDAIDLPVVLPIAGITTRVDVMTTAPAIEARRTQISEEITIREIDELPLNGRNYLDLALLAPGVSRTVQRNTERFAETSAVPGTGISVAGQRNLSNTFIVDGTSANDDAAGLAGTYFAEEVIREFQVVASGGIAEFGRASAVSSMSLPGQGPTSAAAALTGSFGTIALTRAIRFRRGKTRCDRRSSVRPLPGRSSAIGPSGLATPNGRSSIERAS